MILFGALFGFINSAQQIYVDIYDLGVWFPVVFACDRRDDGGVVVPQFTPCRAVRHAKAVAWGSARLL